MSLTVIILLPGCLSLLYLLGGSRQPCRETSRCIITVLNEKLFATRRTSEARGKGAVYLRFSDRGVSIEKIGRYLKEKIIH